ncbi:hypothetical protein Glove_363g37 [Diversispora epigaea]|uniref:Uncharacterized protein n=1 Tax=Diversispora epigaea TaxID=1348612 RepID=A0A397H8S8_9GLOM|nr:hypothetical protein Glove_363g37 [Diversispora epigaea]
MEQWLMHNFATQDLTRKTNANNLNKLCTWNNKYDEEVRFSKYQEMHKIELTLLGLIQLQYDRAS